MNKFLAILVLIGLTFSAVFANNSADQSTSPAEFSSPAAATAYTTSGDMSVSTDLAVAASAFLGGDTVVMARTGGCTVSCTGGCTVSCTNTCTTRCKR